MSEISLKDRLSMAWAAFRRTGGIDLPDLGRSSEENLGNAMSSWMNRYSTVSPIVNFEMLKCLRDFWIFNPDVSQYVDNLQSLGNTGHKIVIDAKSESVAENALKRINETASRIYKNAAGVDGLLNQYIAQIAWSGALSSEDIVNFSAKRVEQTVIVPVLQIRFKFDEELQEYRPYQKTNKLTRRDGNMGLIPLHTETYKYYALQTIENYPYAKPPASAAIDPITNAQTPIFENVQKIVKKFGLMGLTTANVAPPPPKRNETPAEYQARVSAYLRTVGKSLASLLPDGFMVGLRDMKFEHTDVTGGAKGVTEVNQMVEQQVMSGLGMQPAFFGRTDSTTETYADVVYSLLTAKVQNIQRLVKRRQEQTYRLDQRLAGIDVDGISLQFNRTFSRNRVAEAQATEIEVRTAIQKAERGIITADEAAQELGYESAFDPSILQDNTSLGIELGNLARRADTLETRSFAFRFDKKSQSYKPAPSQINLDAQRPENAKAENFGFSNKKNIVPFEKKKAQQFQRV